MAKIIDNPDVETPSSNTVAQTVMDAQKVGGANYHPITENMISKLQENNKTQPVQQMQQTQPVQQIQPAQQNQPIQQASLPVQTASDLNDATVQSYMNDYKRGMEIGDYQAQINALSAIDNYRKQYKLEPIYQANIYELTNLRQQKMDNAIKDYESQISNAVNSGDYESAQQLGQSLTQYKKDVNYKDTTENAANYLRDVEYKSQYNDMINNIVNELYTMRFTYNPAEDQALRLAQEYATNTAMEKMNARGLLNSTMTQQIVTATVNQLQVQYQKMAQEEFYQNIERLKSMANFIVDLDQYQYNRWANQVSTRLQYYEALKGEQDYQWQRINNLGYVDNEASIILGVPVGTISPAIRQSIIDAQAATQKAYDNLTTDIALYQAKAEIDAKYDAIKTQNKLASDITLAQVKAELNGTTGTTTWNEGDTVSSNTKFNGTLTTTELQEQMQIMYENNASDKEMLEFALKNANSYKSYVGALKHSWSSTSAAGVSSTKGWGYTVDEANKILGEKPAKTNAGLIGEGAIRKINSILNSETDKLREAIIDKYFMDSNYNMSDEEMNELANRLNKMSKAELQAELQKQ